MLFRSVLQGHDWPGNVRELENYMARAVVLCRGGALDPAAIGHPGRSERRFKPAPDPYRMVARELGLETRQLRMIAAHAWDVGGAMEAGCAAAFIARPGKALFPALPKPDIIGHDLQAVAEAILAAEPR